MRERFSRIRSDEERRGGLVVVLAIYGRLVQGEEGLQYALKGGRQFSDKNVLSSQISDKSHNRQIFNRKVTMQISDAIEKEVEYTHLCINTMLYT